MQEGKRKDRRREGGIARYYCGLDTRYHTPMTTCVHRNGEIMKPPFLTSRVGDRGRRIEVCHCPGVSCDRNINIPTSPVYMEEFSTIESKVNTQTTRCASGGRQSPTSAVGTPRQPASHLNQHQRSGNAISLSRSRPMRSLDTREDRQDN